MAKQPFTQLQKHFSQRGGAKRRFKIHSITGKEIELDIDTKLRVIDLKRAIGEKNGIETDSQKLIHWKGGPDSFREGEYMVLDNSEKLSTIPFDKDVETDLDLILEPMCQIVSIEDDVKYLSTKYEMKDPPCRLWTFLLENGEEFKVYRTNRAKAGGRYITYLVPRKDEDITTTKARIYNNIYDVLGYSASTFGATARDGFVIECTLQTHETQENMKLNVGEPLVLTKDVRGEYLIHLPVFCECGLIVDLDKMKAHLKTKVLHPHGDEEGKKFMVRASAYVSKWTP